MPQPKETLAQRLKRSREDAQLTQQQLADAASISAAAIGLLEIGNSKTINSLNLFSIAAALNKNPQWLATGDGPEDAQHLLDDIVKQLTPTEQTEAVEFVRYKITTSSAPISEQTRATYISAIDKLKRKRNGAD